MSRKWLIENFEMMVDIAAESKRTKRLSFMPSYSPPSMPEDAVEYPLVKLLAQEREALGFYLSGHPLDGLDEFINDNTTCPINEVPMDEWVTVGGVITFLEVKRTKKGDDMAVVTLEDRTGATEVVFFPGSYAKVRAGLAEDTVVFISGKLDDRNFIGNRLEVPNMKGKQ